MARSVKQFLNSYALDTTSTMLDHVCLAASLPTTVLPRVRTTLLRCKHVRDVYVSPVLARQYMYPRAEGRRACSEV